MALVGLASVAMAQDNGAGGMLVRIDTATGLRYESEEGTRLTTDLGLQFSTQTRNQSLSFDLGTRLAYGDTVEETVRRTRLDLSYAIAARRTRLAANLGYSETPVDGEIPLGFDEFTGEDLLLEDDGFRQILSAGVTLETGLGGPFQTQTTLGYQLLDYRDTADPGLIGRERVSLNTTLRFVVSPVLTLDTFVNYSEVEFDDTEETERVSLRYGVGASYEVSPVLTVSANLAFSEIEESEDDGFGGRVTEITDGLSGGITLRLARPNGSIGLSYNRTVSTGGSRDTLLFSRAMALPRGIDLDLSVGVTVFDEGEIGPRGSLVFSMPTAQGGTVTASLGQSVVVNDDNETRLNTRFGLGYSAPINGVSGYSLNASLINVTVIDGADPDRTRATIGGRYRYELTRDWDLAVGAEYRVTFEDGEQDNDEGLLFLTVERSFSFRP